MTLFAKDDFFSVASPRSPIFTNPVVPLMKILSHFKSLCIIGGVLVCRKCSPFKICRHQLLRIFSRTPLNLLRQLKIRTTKLRNKLLQGTIKTAIAKKILIRLKFISRKTNYLENLNLSKKQICLSNKYILMIHVIPVCIPVFVHEVTDGNIPFANIVQVFQPIIYPAARLFCIVLIPNFLMTTKTKSWQFF